MKQLIVIALIAAAFTGCATGPTEFNQGCMIGSTTLLMTVGVAPDVDKVSDMCDSVELKYKKQRMLKRQAEDLEDMQREHMKPRSCPLYRPDCR